MRLFGIIILSLLFGSADLVAQGVWGIKGGISLGMQRWNTFERQALLATHADIVYESITDETGAFSFYMYGGYHVRGSSTRHRGFTYVNDSGRPVNVNGRTERFEFRNAVFSIGAKQKFALSETSQYYYLIGLRGEYTLSVQFGNAGFSSAFGLSDFYLNRINYGASVGGGLEFDLTSTLQGFVELSVHPDFSRQYLQPPLNNVSNPFNPGNLLSIGERSIMNVSAEISFGIKFFKKDFYEEEDKMW